MDKVGGYSEEDEIDREYVSTSRTLIITLKSASYVIDGLSIRRLLIPSNFVDPTILFPVAKLVQG